jgi:hypothetical protein
LKILDITPVFLLKKSQKGFRKILSLRFFRIGRLWGSKIHKRYEGKVNRYLFTMRPIVSRRTSFSIKGNIEKANHGTIINIKMRPYLSVIITILGVIIYGIFAVLISLVKIQKFDSQVLISLIMGLIGYIASFKIFKLKSVKSKKFLAELFEEGIQK